MGQNAQDYTRLAKCLWFRLTISSLFGVIRLQVGNLSEIRIFIIFGPQILRVRIQNFLPNFANYTHFLTSGDVLWHSAEGPRRLRAEEKEEETTAAKHNTSDTAIGGRRHNSNRTVQ